MSWRVTASLQTAMTSLVGLEIVQWIGIWRRNYARGRTRNKGRDPPNATSKTTKAPCRRIRRRHGGQLCGLTRLLRLRALPAGILVGRPGGAGHRAVGLVRR